MMDSIHRKNKEVALDLLFLVVGRNFVECLTGIPGKKKDLRPVRSLEISDHYF